MLVKSAFISESGSIDSILKSDLCDKEMKISVFHFDEIKDVIIPDLDLICIVGETLLLIEDVLNYVRMRSKSVRVFVFKNQLRMDDSRSLLKKGADAALFNDDDIIKLQLKVYLRNYENYIDAKKIGDLVFNPLDQELKYKDKVIILNATENRIVRLLTRDVGQVISYEDISCCMVEWKADSSKEYAKVYMHRLRKSLKAIGCSDVKIVNHYGRGYAITKRLDGSRM